MKFRKPRHYERNITYYPEFKKLYKDKETKCCDHGYNNHMNWDNKQGQTTTDSILEKLEPLKH